MSASAPLAWPASFLGVAPESEGGNDREAAAEPPERRAETFAAREARRAPRNTLKMHALHRIIHPLAGVTRRNTERLVPSGVQRAGNAASLCFLYHFFTA